MVGATHPQSKTEQGQGGAWEVDRQFTQQVEQGTIWMLSTSQGNKGSLSIEYHNIAEKLVANGYCCVELMDWAKWCCLQWPALAPQINGQYNVAMLGQL